VHLRDVGSKRAGRTIRGEDLARFVEDLFEHSPEVGAILQLILQALVRLGSGMDSRKPMVWSDMEYEPETYNPDGTTREPDVVAVDEDLLAHYKHLIGIRNRHEALHVGAYRTLVADEGGDSLRLRTDPGERTHHRRPEQLRIGFGGRPSGDAGFVLSRPARRTTSTEQREDL
jgi:hypothetical protein